MQLHFDVRLGYVKPNTLSPQNAAINRDEAATHLKPKQLEKAQSLANQYFQK